MMKFPMSRVGADLLRQVLARAGTKDDTVRLVSYRACDWRSMTFDGERQDLMVRVMGSEVAAISEALTVGIEDHEFAIRGQIVADIGAVVSHRDPSGAVDIRVEALTIAA